MTRVSALSEIEQHWQGGGIASVVAKIKIAYRWPEVVKFGGRDSKKENRGCLSCSPDAFLCRQIVRAMRYLELREVVTNPVVANDGNVSSPRPNPTGSGGMYTDRFRALPMLYAVDSLLSQRSTSSGGAMLRGYFGLYAIRFNLWPIPMRIR